MPQLMHPDLTRILAREDIAQLTPKWFEWRGRMVTASQVASITGECPYKSTVQLLKEKVRSLEQQSHHKALANNSLVYPALLKLLLHVVEDTVFETSSAG